MSNAFQNLHNWTREHYNFTLHANGGDKLKGGSYIVLKGGGRTVQVIESQLDVPTIDNLINEALSRWHEDETEKHFAILYEYEESGVTLIMTAYFCASNEEQAKEKLKISLIDGVKHYTVVKIWEMTKNWTH